MTPTWIEVDDDVLAMIKEEAEPFVDTPNDALRQLLGIGPAPAGSCSSLPSDRPPPRPSFPRASPGELLSLDEYELPLLKALSQLGGSAARSEVVKVAEGLLGDKLRDLDREQLHTGAVRWENRLGFARLKAVERGHLCSDSRRGVWQLTEAGIVRLGQLEAELEKQHEGEVEK